MSSVTMLKKAVYASSNSSPLSNFHHELPQSIQWIITSSPSSRWQEWALIWSGGLFLAYDLFGRQGGPLRVLIFVLIYSATVDLMFGLIAGAGLGLTLAFELGSTRG